MPNTNPLDTLDTNASELRLNRFEAVWLAQRGDEATPDWRQHLPADDEPCSPDLIFYLLQRDIECRIKAGLPALLAEGYFEHPRLQREDARLDAKQQVELIHWEYQQRLQNGERPRRAEYEAAFPGHVEALREMKPRSRCPQCSKILVLEETYQTLLCPDCGSESQWIVATPRLAMQTTLSSEMDPRGYALLETLGKGGMGEVYRCGDPALGRDLAIKVMKTDLTHHPEVERRSVVKGMTLGRRRAFGSLYLVMIVMSALPIYLSATIILAAIVAWRLNSKLQLQYPAILLDTLNRIIHSNAPLRWFERLFFHRRLLWPAGVALTVGLPLAWLGVAADRVGLLVLGCLLSLPFQLWVGLLMVGSCVLVVPWFVARFVVQSSALAAVYFDPQGLGKRLMERDAVPD